MLVRTVALPLVYFASYTNEVRGITHNVEVKYDYDQMQTNREFERREKILEFEYDDYDASVDLFNLYGESPQSC